jgi:hypothetical protein
MHALTAQEIPKNRSVDEGEATMPLVHIDLQKGKTSALNSIHTRKRRR